VPHDDNGVESPIRSRKVPQKIEQASFIGRVEELDAPLGEERAEAPGGTRHHAEVQTLLLQFRRIEVEDQDGLSETLIGERGLSGLL
jgi:hypothetical protein